MSDKVHPLLKKPTYNQDEYDSAFVKRPFLSLTVVCLWIGIIILFLMGGYELMYMRLKTSLNLFLYALLLFFIWLPVHIWAIKNPKT